MKNTFLYFYIVFILQEIKASYVVMFFFFFFYSGCCNVLIQRQPVEYSKQCVDMA